MPDLWAASYMARIQPLMRWSLTSTVTPTPFSTRSFASIHSPRLTEPSLYLLFSKQNFQNYFWALSRGPRCFCPSYSNSPTPAAYPQIFSDVSTTIFHPCLSRFIQALPDWTKPASIYLFFSFSPKSMSDRREGHTTYYLSQGPRGFCPSFSNSPTPATYRHIFSQISTSILTTFFTVLPNGLTTRSYVLLALHPWMPDLWAAPYMARIHPSMRWSLTSTVTPTPLRYSFFSFSPQS